MAKPSAGMRRRPTLGLAVAVIALATTIACAPFVHGAEAKTKRPVLGVIPTAAIDDADFARMAESGVDTIRVLLLWSQVERTPGTYQWGDFDYYATRAARHGIEILPILYSVPDWVSGRSDCGACAPETPEARSAFAAFAHAAVGRYGPGGSFWSGSATGTAPCGCSKPVPVHAWQVWNEENSPKYYAPAPSPETYASLVRETGPAIRAVDPSAQVVLGGMWGPPGVREVIPTNAFLRRFYSVPGIEGAFDGIALHPYSGKLNQVLDQIRRTRRVARAAGDRRVGTWITELGWASAGPSDSKLVKSPGGQAKLLKRSFRALLSRRREWRIRAIFWYSWRDTPPHQTDCRWCPYAGLRNQSGAEKPAGRAFRQVAR